MADLASLNLNLLLALDALLAERSVTRAGRRLGLAQSSMSHALANLRGVFEDPLLVRSAEGMVPTPRALELEAPLREALRMLESAIEAPAAFDPGTASLTFGLASDAVQQVILLPHLLRVLQERAPGVVLHTEAPRVATETYRRLAGGELDFAIGHFEEPPTGLHRKRLATDRIVYIARKGHPRIRQALSRAEGRRERLLVQELVTAGQLPSNARDVHQSRDRIHGVIATTPHPLASLFVVSQSDVITGTVERLAEAYRDVLGLSVLPAPEALPPVETHIVWHDRTDRSPAHRWLLGLIEEAAQGSTRPLPSRRRRNRGAA